MAKKDTILTNFHKSSSKSAHRSDSIGNQGIINEGKQVGSIEYVPTSSGEIDLSFHNHKGKEI
ncbi:MAG: hypothetical protein PQJ45_03245 [Sphaerochaetaceae bacterium]|nr:hypothetical protein [Sphaerochaetaceae bacterium]